MIRVQRNGTGPQLRFDVNATYGEDGAPVARSFVPALGRLAASSLDPQVGNGLSPGTLQFDPTLGGALAPARGPVKSGGTRLPTSTLLLVGGGLLALGTVTYFIARSVR